MPRQQGNCTETLPVSMQINDVLGVYAVIAILVAAWLAAHLFEDWLDDHDP